MQTMNPTDTQSVSRYLKIDPGWLALREEPVLLPELAIVDAHHHVLDRPGWRYLFDDLLADTRSGHNIVATVFVQCLAMHRATGPEWLRPVGETEFVNGVAAMSASGAYGAMRACAAIVAYADLRMDEGHLRELLEAHIRAGNGRLRGIRQIVAWGHEDILNNPEAATHARMLADPLFRRGFAQLAALGLSFDAWLYHPQISELESLARAFPGMSIVLNHFGGPLGIASYAGRRDAVFAEWSAAIRRLAACPNVHMKLGGLGMRVNGFDFHTLKTPPSSEDLARAWRPYVETCLDAFGARRCMFESNFPVDKGSYSYAVCWNAFKRLASGASAAEQARLFSGTAAGFYQLDGIAG